MSTRLSRVATGMLVVAILLMSGRSWAIYYGLGASKDDWGLKYDVVVNEVDHDTLSVEFTLADEGRMKPIYALELIAFSKETDNQGGHGYDVNAPIELKPTKDGRRGASANPQGICRPRHVSDPHPHGRRPATTVRGSVLYYSA